MLVIPFIGQGSAFSVSGFGRVESVDELLGKFLDDVSIRQLLGHPINRRLMKKIMTKFRYRLKDYFKAN